MEDQAAEPIGSAIDELSADSRLKLLDNAPRGIKDSLGLSEGYAGDAAKYREWLRAIESRLKDFGLTELPRFYKDDAADTWTPEDWATRYHQNDLQFIYDVVTRTLTTQQLDDVEQTGPNQNGILVLRKYYIRHGANSLANTIRAWSELQALNVEAHTNPVSAFTANAATSFIVI